MKISIIGLGLIGGSLGLALKKTNPHFEILGVEKNENHAQQAVDLGLVDKIFSLNEAAEKSDVMFLATPAEVVKDLLPGILDSVRNTIVCDLASTKKEIVENIHLHPNRKNYVAAHPMAGTEFSSPSAAQNNLFQDKVCVICNSEESDSKAISAIIYLFQSIGMKIKKMNASLHDSIAAKASHLSHLSSFALALSLGELNEQQKDFIDLAGGGLESSIRLANSSSEMWVPIFLQNQNNILEVLDEYIIQLQKFRNSISMKNEKNIHELIKKANKLYQVIHTSKKEVTTNQFS